jgi:tellurite resistance protein
MPPMAIAALVPSSIGVTAHADALLEVAFLISAVDGYLADEELIAFSELVAKVRGRETSKEEIGQLLERFVFAAHTTLVPERLRAVAKIVPPEMRETVFKVAVALAMADHDESEHEDELVGILGAVLEVSDRIKALTAEARAAVEG